MFDSAINVFGWSMVSLAFLVVWFLVAALVAAWVYKDAESRGKSGIIWLVIVLLTGLFGLVVWLLVRPDRSARAASFDSTEKYLFVGIAAVAVIFLLSAWAFGLIGGAGTVEVPVDGSSVQAEIAGYNMLLSYNPGASVVTVVTQGNWGQVQVSTTRVATMNLVDGEHHVSFIIEEVGNQYVRVHWSKKAGVSAFAPVPYFTR